MILDARNFGKSKLSYDVCIIGAGPAGLALALELSAWQKKILIVESGSERLSDRHQSLNEGRYLAHEDTPLKYLGLRMLGGSSGHWTGISRPLDSFDFTRRDWVPLSGWPLKKSDLIEDFERAARFLGVSLADEVADGPRLPNLNLGADLNVVDFYRCPVTNLWPKHRDKILMIGNIDVLTEATVTRLRGDTGNMTIETAEASVFDGRSFVISAKIFVLACGGIGNARTLLSSRTEWEHGIGNWHDCVGRYFHQHTEIPCDLYLQSNFEWPRRFFFDLEDFARGGKYGDGARIFVQKLAPTPQWLARKRSLNFSVNPQGFYQEGSESPSGGDVSDSGLAGSVVAEALVKGRRVLRDKSYFMRFQLCMEQTPHSESRVVLSSDKDEFGVPRANIRWLFTELDRHSIQCAAEALGKFASGNGLGRVRVDPELISKGPPQKVTGGHHPMGTTRMSDDPKKGVVDSDCRVHGLKNLYIAGSSVFPTGGHAPPTLNLVALAIRLARHLRRA